MEKIILIVDNDVTSLKLASDVLEKEHRVAAAINAGAAFRYLEKNTPHLILLDLDIPDMDGLDVLERLKAHPEYYKIPVIVFSAPQTPEDEALCLAAGAVDCISKPYAPPVLLGRVQRTMELYEYRNKLETIVEEQARHHFEQIDSIQNAVILGMANLIEERDGSTGHHVKNTQNYVKMLAYALLDRKMYPSVLTPDYVNLLVKAAPLHDVGKIKITDLILQKPGKLSEEEYQVMKNHTRLGADIIEEILGDIEDENYLKIARDVALYHHERWDGNGYPEGLRGGDIPLGARIMALADVFDALSADRVYHRGLDSIDEVLSIIEESSGTQFDPTIAKVFLSMRDELKAHVEQGRVL